MIHAFMTAGTAHNWAGMRRRANHTRKWAVPVEGPVAFPAPSIHAKLLPTRERGLPSARSGFGKRKRQ
jgi:hypothetical protein